MAINLRNNVTGTGLNLVTNPILKSSATNPVNIGVKTPVNQYKTEDPRYANKTQVNTQVKTPVQTTKPMTPVNQTQVQTQVQTPVNNNQSRFIGFQNNNTLQNSLNILQQRQQTQGNTTKKTTTAKTTKDDNYTYDELVKAIQDFHYDVKNSDGKLTKQQISKKYPEFKGKEEEALRLQEALLPYVKDNEFAPIEGIQQNFPDLLQNTQINQKISSDGTTASYINKQNDKEWNDEFFGRLDTTPLDEVTGNKVKGFLGNLAKSTWNVIADVGNMVINPLDTANALAKTAVGAGMNVLGIDDNLSEEGWLAEANQIADGLGDFLKERYGGKQEILNTLYSDPAGVISDIATLVTGGAGAVKGVASGIAKGAAKVGLANTARTAGNISKTASRVMNIANKADPYTQATNVYIKGGEKAINTVKNTITGEKNIAKNIAKNADNTEIKAGEVKQGENIAKVTGKSEVKNNITKNISKVAEEKPGVVERITDWGARKITGTTTAQDKLIKAQEPRMNVLTRKKDLEQRRANSDRSNELIIEQGYTPTNSAERLEAHDKTMQAKWKEIEDAINDNNGTKIDLNDVADSLEDFIREQKEIGTSLTKSDLETLTKEAIALREKGVIDLMTAERLKQVYNSLINNWGEQKVTDTFANGLRKATAKIGKIEDDIISKIPGEFTKLKKDFGALKDTYEDVFKANMKNQRRKGGSFAETYGRIEGAGDIIEGIFGLLSGQGGKVIKGAGKLLLGKSLGKAKDMDFLIREGFKDLAEEMKKNGKISEAKKTKVTSKKSGKKEESKKTDKKEEKKSEPKEEEKKTEENKNKVTSKKEEKTNIKKEPEQKKEDSAPVSDFIKEMEESSKVVDGEINYGDISTRTLNKLYESEKTPKSEKAKIEKELEKREADMNGGAKDYDLLDHEYAYRINQLAEEEKRIGKVGKNDVNKTYKEKQSLELQKKIERLREEMKEDYKDRFSSDAELDDHYNTLRNKGINYINEYKLSKNYSTFKQEDALINSLNERWSKQPKFVRELTEKQQDVRESSIGDYKNDNYEIKTTDYQDSFSSKSNPKEKGAIYWGENPRVVTTSIKALKESGLLEKLPDDMKVEVSGEGEIGTIKDLKNLDSEGALITPEEPKTPRNVIGNGKNNATTRFQKGKSLVKDNKNGYNAITKSSSLTSPGNIRASGGSNTPIATTFSKGLRKIRFQKEGSQPKTDSTGNKLSAQQQEYFADSKVRNDKGELIPVYHGTNAEFTVYDKSNVGTASGDLGFFGEGWYFATHKGEARYYGGNVMEGYLEIKNPFYYGELSKIDGKTYRNSNYVTLRNLGKLDKQIADIDVNGYTIKEIGDMVDNFIKDTKLEKLNDTKDPYTGEDITYWKVTTDGKSEIKTAIKGMTKDEMIQEQLNHYMYDKIGYVKVSDIIEDMTSEARFSGKKSFTDILKDKGHDGIIVGESASKADEIVAFESNQFKNIDNKTPTTNPDIRFQKIGDKEVEIKPNAESPQDLSKVNDKGLTELTSFKSKQQAEKALNVSKELIAKDGNPYLWTHTNKYKSNIITDFRNVEDSKYKQFTYQGIQVGWFTNNEEMSFSYSYNKTKLAPTKRFESVDEVNKFLKDNPNVYEKEFNNGNLKSSTSYRLNELEDGRYELVSESKETVTQPIQGFYDDINNDWFGGNIGEMPKDTAEAIKKLQEYYNEHPTSDGEVTVKLLKDGKAERTTIKEGEPLKYFKDKESAVAEGASFGIGSDNYHYQGIIQDVKNPLVVDIKGEGNNPSYWNKLGKAGEFFSKNEPELENKIQKMKNTIREAEKDRQTKWEWTDSMEMSKEYDKALSEYYKAKEERMGDNTAIDEAQAKLDTIRSVREKIESMLYRGGKPATLTEAEKNFKVGNKTLGEIYDNALDIYNKHSKEFSINFNNRNEVLDYIAETIPEVISMLNKNKLFHYNVDTLSSLGMADIFGYIKDFDMETNDYVFYALKKGGYDGVLFKNVKDYGSNPKEGWENAKGGDVLATFNSKQFKSWNNENPTDSKYIMYEKNGVTEGKNGEGYIGRSSFTDKSLNKAIENMKKTGLAKDVKTVDTVSDLRKELKGKISKSDLLQVDGEIAGCTTPDGTVYLVKEFLRDDTLKHEFAHRFRSYAEKNNPELFKAINKVAEEAPTELKERIKRDYGELSDDALLDEVFAWKQGEFKVTGAELKWYQKMWKAIEEVWNSIKSKFGKNYADLSAFDGWEKMSSEQIMSKINDILENGKKVGKPKNLVTNKRLREQAVWHGSPYEFDKFDSSHMGKGEGAQAHGWGHYVAVDKDTGKRYAGLKKSMNNFTYKGKEWNKMIADGSWQDVPQLNDLVHEMQGYDISFDEAKQKRLDYLKNDINNMEEWLKDDSLKEMHNTYRRLIEKDKKGIKDLEKIKKSDFDGIDRNLYELDIPDPVKKNTPTGKNYLDEGKIIRKGQVDKFLNAAKEKLKSDEYNKLKDYIDKWNINGGMITEDLYSALDNSLGGQKQASKFLESLGYDGIHYFGGQDGEAYVIFNDDALKINSHTKYQKTKATGNSKNRVTSK